MIINICITQSLDQVKISSISQLIKGISRVLQKLLKYFSGAIISTSSLLEILPLLLSAAVWPVILALKWNESVALAQLKSEISPLLSTTGISLIYCHNLPDVFE